MEGLGLTSQAGENGLRGLNFGERSIECGQVGQLHVRCLDLLAGKLQRSRSAAVLREQTIEAKVGSGAYGGVHAHVSHHACHDESRGTRTAQTLEQRCFAEATWKVLRDDSLFGRGLHGDMNVSSLRAWEEERCAGSFGDVLNVEDGQGASSKRFQEDLRLHNGLFCGGQLHGSPREVVVLEVDEDESGSHKSVVG